MFGFFKRANNNPAPGTDTPTAPVNGWMGRLRQGLSRSGQSITRLFGASRGDDAWYESLEDALLGADAGVPATERLIAALRQRARAKRIEQPEALRGELVELIHDSLLPLEKGVDFGERSLTAIMLCGVNGAGKTTTIGKLAKHLSDQGARVLLGAGDTFRAAAREQLLTWAQRNQVQSVSQPDGDPASVAFDAVQAGLARGCDVVMVDTAGRLPTQLHLMDELTKIKRVMAKAMPDAPHEVWLVIDGTNGQNALTQVKAFDQALGLTGVIVTKLDGTAKGGILLALAQQHPVPVRFVGVGEGLHDINRFDAKAFAQALLDSPEVPA
ncbi:MAG: signal recognition particle-docking protein FtsY [Burkholderiaceae bacterium]